MLWLLLFAPTAVAALQLLLALLLGPLPRDVSSDLARPALPVSPDAEANDEWVIRTTTVSKLILAPKRTRRRL
jgi:hypothetical protein